MGRVEFKRELSKVDISKGTVELRLQGELR
jgi:hypothetical protein